MSIDLNTIVIISGLFINLFVFGRFFTRLEHRLTKTETNIMHIMRNSGMSVREEYFSE